MSGKLSETANGRLKKNLGCQVFARSKISPPSGQLHCVWDNKSGLQVVQESETNETSQMFGQVTHRVA